MLPDLAFAASSTIRLQRGDSGRRGAKSPPLGQPSPTLKLRYLALLFAKEVVLRSSQDPRLDAPLEQLVEIASFADRNLGRRRRRDGERED